jgi:hypothetical protein
MLHFTFSVVNGHGDAANNAPPLALTFLLKGVCLYFFVISLTALNCEYRGIKESEKQKAVSEGRFVS